MTGHNRSHDSTVVGDTERVRSTPLRPLIWMTSVLVWAAVAGLSLQIPPWAGMLLCVMTAVSFMLFAAAYVYLFVNDREMLRSERFRGRRNRNSAESAEGKSGRPE